MRNRILSLLLLILLSVSFLCPLRTYAVEPLDPAADASLTLYYQKDSNAFPDLNIRIYRVARACEDGTFALIAPFSSYPVNIHGITMQEQWTHVASTLASYITANQVSPTQETKTDANGTAQFPSLETGLYLVQEVTAENSTGTYVFNRFMIYLPTPQPDGSYHYAVEAKPKCTGFVPKTQYSVTKLWQDTGNQNSRPKNITVDIYKDGKLQESQILSSVNNWTYTWQVSADDPGKWTVTERDVPDRYQVTIQEKGSVFSIINTCHIIPEIPQTGDSFTPLPWILIMCLSGIGLLILGIYGRRHK